MNPFNQTAGFMDLLTSQQDTPILQPNGIDRDSPSIDLGESQVPVFSSQWSPSEAENIPATRMPRKRNKWTSKEDVVLISAWLNTSKDPIIGNEQRGVAFWNRIANYYAASPNVSTLKERLPSHLKQRWAKINKMVCKFVGSYQAATNQMTSGQNDDDLMKLAHQIYETDYKKKFMLEHAWRELKHDQKWCASQRMKETGNTKKRMTEDGPEASQASQGNGESDSPQARPPGVKAAKAAKAKGKNPANNLPTVEEEGEAALKRIHTIWDIKQQDFAMKQQEHAMKKELTNKRLLDSLLSKSTPLTEIEEDLKNKLIREIML
ncbi:No apical meristem-associated C-terminal domain [Arabidopsis thaliana x Arabidopsis arenosa]|uniref:No apical meristem-associated C-terminal domain n=1 Tax=Arabidopsis thaliana x Arabidopsis arenosa TaxID=1240361 RepID=A0A8T2A3Y1_9BRAS|nr:No apical meristem-associated C-terminal domain [Arabidopsis thaliana x Arabidopsis arenosa]